MRQLIWNGLLIGACASGSVAMAQGDTLAPGDPAPLLADVTWLQGEPVPAWIPGRVYVLDFWATWCAPCRASIPHLNELATRHADGGVTVIGVAIWPSSGMTPTDEFVRDQGDAMSYPVAEDVDGRSAETFMRATGQNGIPTAMVIDGQGLLVWIGHPRSGLDEVVEQVLAGSFDAAAFAREESKREEEQRQQDEAVQRGQARLYQAMDRKDWDEVARAADELAERSPELAGRYSLYQYEARARKGPPEAAAAFGQGLLAGSFRSSPQRLESLARFIAGPRTRLEPTQQDLDLALQAAQRAVNLTGREDLAKLQLLARVRFCRGEHSRALSLQLEAMRAAPSRGQRRQMQSVLDRYVAAVQAQDGS